MFGAPWTTGYGVLENRTYAALHGQDFFGIGVPKTGPFLSSLFSAEVGLFFFSPLLLVGLGVVVVDSVRGGRLFRSAAVTLLACTLLLFAFIAGHRGWRGGWVVGPRYISELSSLLLIPAVFWFDGLAKTKRKLALGFLTGLSAVGILHSGVAGVFFPHLSHIYKNPVYESLVPLIRNGFSPDSWALWLGLPAPVSAFLVLALLFAPLVVLVFQNPGISKGAAARMILMPAIFALGLALVLGPRILPSTAADAVGRETRHLYDIWRPLDGNPHLAGKAHDEVGVPMQAALDQAKQRHFARHMKKPLWPDGTTP
jgi:hypothetical protein